MALFEGKTPAERNKMIAAIVLPLLALIFVWRMFSGPSGPTTANTNSNRRATQRNTAQQRANAPPPADAQQADGAEVAADITPVDCCGEQYLGGEAGRNIFAFYVKPVAPPTPTPAAPTPTPAPPPDKVLGSLAPQSVFARTGGFTLQISGDKFGPADRVYIDGQEMQTQYKSMQQLTATIPAAVVAGPGQRSVMVRTPDGKLFSNQAQLNVMQPPAPTYTFVGFLKRRQANTAVLKDAKGELYSVAKGDIIEGRFRVTDISDQRVEVTDKDLNIKHALPFINAPGTPGRPGQVPGSIQPPPPAAEG
ncbi:MAG TPA: IPT/TIG domain-containing protein, partial [Pyrinomonadaceae bacterium]|nr:IPT/TIG domain-containing protein [Pyrinomonadaceae bacterium]